MEEDINAIYSFILSMQWKSMESNVWTTVLLCFSEEKVMQVWNKWRVS